jgi:mono/diheme cytochrome c family protein
MAQLRSSVETPGPASATRPVPTRAPSSAGSRVAGWRRLVRFGGFALGGLIVLVILVLGGVYLNAQRLLNQRPSNPIEPLAVASTPEQVARGQYLVSTIPGCVSCHASNPAAVPPVLDGALMVDAEPFGHFYAPNLTPGGRLREYSDGALERAIREGIGADGRALAIMPSENFKLLPDDDVAAIIAYLRTQPAVEHETPPLDPNLVGYLLIGSGLVAPSVQPPIAEVTAPERAATPEYGSYLANIGDCRACHGALLDGQKRATGAPEGPNLRVVKGWTDQQFVATIRSGVDPTGYQINPTVMPWRQFGRASDEDLRALYAYLVSLP